MRVLTIFAHHGSNSFCHAVLERFTAGLRDAGHNNEVVDLYAINFDPVLRERDMPNWIDENAPPEILEQAHLREHILQEAQGPLERFMMKRALGDKDTGGIIRLLQEHNRPEDIVDQQRKVASAQAMAFIAPVYFVGFPAILKGWIERVFTLGFAFSLSPEGWRGDISGRVPLLTHEKALIIQTTLFNEGAYKAGLADAMKVLMDDFGFRYPGVQTVEHVYFYAVHSADEATRTSYLKQAYQLGLHF
jgi:NAD(P)H dehydrogenase (quinone)